MLSFNSRTLGRVRLTLTSEQAELVKVSIHAPWEGCDQKNLADADAVRVSIHAPWEGCDQASADIIRQIEGFNSRTLGRVRLITIIIIMEQQQFQFTHPGKGATRYSKLSDDRVKFQFTHPGKGATESRGFDTRAGKVSIHAPWEGCDHGG